MDGTADIVDVRICSRLRFVVVGDRRVVVSLGNHAVPDTYAKAEGNERQNYTSHVQLARVL